MPIIAQSKLNYLYKSKNSWKSRSLKEAREKRNAIRQRKYYQSKAEKKELELEKLFAENKRLQKEALYLKENFNQNGVIESNKSELILLIMHIALFCKISFRAIPRVLSTLSEKLRLKIKIPHFTTIIFWQQKLGLYLLSQVGKTKDKWCLIMDSSIKLGGMKVLLVLMVKLDAIRKNRGAIKASDCQTIGIFPGSSLTGEARLMQSYSFS